MSDRWATGEDALTRPLPNVRPQLATWSSPKTSPRFPRKPNAEGSAHTEIQYLLLKLGADMGFDVHVASNDQGRVWNGQRLGDMPAPQEAVAAAVRPGSKPDYRVD